MDKLKSFADSPFPGIAKVPTGEFVEGLVGRAFVPGADLTIQGDGVMPAPEGTISLWIKPVKYEEDWLNGPLLTPGRIGPFLTTVMRGDGKGAHCSLQVRWGRHDCCSGLHWNEFWPGSVQQFRETGANAMFDIWQDGKWRMLTVVWFTGERRIYFNGVRLQHGVEVPLNPTQPGEQLTIPAGSKAVDELMVWDTPLTDAQVAALFFARVPQSGLQGTVQYVPKLATPPAIGKANQKAAWDQAAQLTDWVDAVSGMAAAANDTLELGHRDGQLFLRYREPMPKNYIEVKTLLGGTMMKRSVVKHDDNVWADDCVEVRLTPDNSKTNYVLALSASGATHDARNGDTAFEAKDWVVYQDAGEQFWTVEMRINLAALSGAAVPNAWGINVVRTVRQQGFARRQCSFAAGDAQGYARLALRPSEEMPVTADLDWSPTRGKLAVAVRSETAGPLTISTVITPLGHVAILPDEEEVNDMVRRAGRDKVPVAVTAEREVPKGAVGCKDELDYVEGGVALASLTVKDPNGALLATRSCLISGSEMVSTRMYNLPSRKELVVQVFLASETLAGADVVGDITLMPEGKTTPVLRKTVTGFSGIMEEAVIDVSKVAIGHYQVHVAVRKDGKLLGQRDSRWFKSGDPPWLGNDIGIITEVPKPWTPVTAQGDRLSVWGREHAFTRSLLPTSLRVLDEEILAGPMRLLITTAAGTLDTAVVETPSFTVDKAGIRATISGKAVGQDLTVEVNGVLEFDGFANLKFTMQPRDGQQPVAIERIVFEAPFKKQYAELYDDSSYNMFRTESGRIPAEGMAITSTGTVRVGDAQRGVQFYPFIGTIGKRTTAKPLIFTPEGDVMRLRYIVSEGVTLDGPLTASLGIIGTPTKPYDAKRVRLTGHAGPKLPADLKEKGYASAIYWTAGWSTYNGGKGQEDGYYHYTPEWCAGLAKSRKATWENEGKYAALYVVPGMITAQTPEYALFYKEWDGQYFEGLEAFMCDLSQYRGAEVRPEGRWTAVDYTKRSYQDFYFYSLDRVLAAFAAEGVRVGIYVDCTFHHGDLTPYRQWMQRLHQVVRKHSPDGVIIIHMSGDRHMALWGMADILVEGEQYTANWAAHIANKPELTTNDCHPTVLPLNRTRATYTGGMWGPQPVFLTQFWTDKRHQEDVKRQETGDPGPTYYLRMRYSTGLMMAHDTPFWGEFYGAGTKEDVWIQRARWGYDDTVEFIPYWDARKLLEVEGASRDTAVVSAWLRPDGKLMALILNTANAAATVRVKVNAAKFPVKLQAFTKAVDISSPVPALEPEAHEPTSYPYRNGTLEVDLRARDFRLLVFE